MEDPTRSYAIPTSAYSISGGLTQSKNGTQSQTNLIDINHRGSIFGKKYIYRTTTIILGVLAAIILLAIIIVAVAYSKTYKKLQWYQKVCSSEECLRSAANLKLSMDETVDPCDDFYRFTCGRWSNEHPNHGWYPKYSIFETIDERVAVASMNYLQSNASKDDPLPAKQVRDFYKSCLDTASLDKLGFSVIYKYLEEVELPLVPNFFKTGLDSSNFKFDWIKTSVNLKKTFAMNLFIQFDIDADMFNRSNYVLYVGSGTSRSPLPSPFKPRRESLKDRHRKRSHRKADDFERQREEVSKRVIQTIITEVLQNVTTKLLLPRTDLLIMASNIVWNISIDLAELVQMNVTDEENLNIKTFTVDELQKLTDECMVASKLEPIKVWEPYVKHLFKGSGKNEFDIKSDLLYASMPEVGYFCNILAYIAKTPDTVLELYNWWVVVESMIVSTNTELTQYINKEMSILYNDPPDLARSRSLECAELVTDFMGMAVSYGIADKAFLNNTLPEVNQMLLYIKQAFVHRVNDLPWMDEETKDATLEKSREMVSFVGFPDWLLNKTALEVYYEDLEISQYTFLENMMQFVKAMTKKTIDNFRKENTKTWRTDPTTVNAYNYFADNSINVPIAILTFPMYHLGLEALNYGTLGSILGHELTHGFDNIGKNYDKEGNYIVWWTNDTLQAFKQKSECFVEQYENYTVQDLDMKVNGHLTLGENLADNGGLHHSFLAYQYYLKQHGKEKRLPGFEKYTNEQLFFIAYGSLWCEIRDDASLTTQLLYDEHSPHNYRVLGALQNSHEFAEHFHCPLGSNMNPDRVRCRIW